MKITASAELNRLNLTLDDIHNDASALKQHSAMYFDLLRSYLPEVLSQIVNETDSRTVSRELQAIFVAQRNIMKIRMVADMEIAKDLWEIAKDFDNDDPQIYDYLIRKIKDEEYIIQNSADPKY